MEPIEILYAKELDEVASARGTKLRRVYVTGLEQLRDAPAMREVLLAGVVEDDWRIENLSQLMDGCQLEANLKEMDDVLEALESSADRKDLHLAALAALQEHMAMLQQQPNRLASEQQIAVILRPCWLAVQCAEQAHLDVPELKRLAGLARNTVQAGRNCRVIIDHTRDIPRVVDCFDDLVTAAWEWSRDLEPAIESVWHSRFLVQISGACLSQAAELRRRLQDEMAYHRWFIVGIDKLSEICYVDEFLASLLSNTKAILHREVPEFPALNNLVAQANQLCAHADELDDGVLSPGTKLELSTIKAWIQKIIAEAQERTMMSEDARSFTTTAMTLIDSLRSQKIYFRDKNEEWLLTPVQSKYEEDGECDDLKFGLATMQGWSRNMHDAFAVSLNCDDSTSFFGVYDGCNGQGVAEFCSKYLLKEIFRKGNSSQDLALCIKHGFLSMDRMMKGQRGWRKLNELCLLEDFTDSPQSDNSDESSDSWEDEEGPHSEFTGPVFGCTACIAIFRNEHLIVANSGNCRCVASHMGHSCNLTADHVPDVQREKERILNAGGSVVAGRVNGTLKFSRGIGFAEYKENEALPAENQIITADPDIYMIPISKDDEFIVLATSGVWECISTVDAVSFVRKNLKTGAKLSKVCSDLLDLCLAPNCYTKTGHDNMTAVVVQFKKPSSTASDEVLWPFD